MFLPIRLRRLVLLGLCQHSNSDLRLLVINGYWTYRYSVYLRTIKFSESLIKNYCNIVNFGLILDTGTAQSLLTKKEISDLKKENSSLKNSIERLNVELSAYQAKYRPIKEEEMVCIYS